jgi:hypothetical protein
MYVYYLAIYMNSNNNPSNTITPSAKPHPFPTSLSTFLLLLATIVVDFEGLIVVGPRMVVVLINDVGVGVGIGSVGNAASKIPLHWGNLLNGINGSDVVELRSAFAILFQAALH